jgi:hypothetical protein
MNPGGALDRLQADLGEYLRAFVSVREAHVSVEFSRAGVDRAIEGDTIGDPHEQHLRQVASSLLEPGGTAAIRYTPTEIVVGLPAPGDGHTGYLVSLDQEASPTVDAFIDTLLARGATIRESSVDGPPGVTGNGGRPTPSE